MGYMEKEKLIKADIVSIENRVRHAFNQGYDLGFKDGKEKANPLKQEPILDKIRAEIEQKIEQERFARSVFCGEEKDAVKAEQCTGSIFAYKNVIRLIDKYKAESDIEKRKEWSHKPCINYKDGCEESAGCPCVYYRAEGSSKE